MDPIEARIRNIVANVANVPADAPGDANLYLDLGVASVHALQLLGELEEQFGVAIPDDQFVEATSIGQLTSMLSGLLRTAGGAARA